MVILKSEDAHYSVEKGANFLGFGTESVVKVKSDDRGRVIPEDLEIKIQQCKQKVGMMNVLNVCSQQIYRQTLFKR